MRLMMTGRAAPLLRLGVFLAGAAASLVLAIAAGSAVIGVAGGMRPLAGMALISALASAGMLLVTGVLRRLGGGGLAALGLQIDRRRLREMAAGFVISSGLFLAVAAVQSAMVGATWQFTGIRGIAGAVADLPIVFCLVLAEELLFRGAALRSLRELAGDRWAIVLTAVVFGLYHVVGTQYWAMGLVFHALMPTLGGLLFAWAAVRSGGLALPIGLHLGGNWVQASLAVFAPHPRPGVTDAAAGLWRIPISEGDVQVLTAPDVLPHLPLLLAFAIAAALTWQLLGRRAAPQLLAPKQ
jgi:membrane protease YdiL (CAAX protease family)